MNKIQFTILSAIFITILSSLFLNKKTKEVSERVEGNEKNVTEEKKTPINPNGENVKILGETTGEPGSENNFEEEPKENKKSEKVVFETSKLYSLINSYRKEKKLTTLSINQSLEVSAKRKIEDMVENKYFRHQDTGNVESWYLFKTAGYEFKTAGENLSSGINTPWQVFEAWINSEIHDEQLTNTTYLDMGISADCESYKIVKKPSCIVVLHLGSR